ncbi:MAG: PKD domain-containing protein [Bacteroidota bacterium]
MKKLLLSVFIAFSFSSMAQTFYGSGGFITDFDSVSHPVVFACNVSGLPNMIDSTFGIERICIDLLTHTYDQDLRIELLSPDSEYVILSFRRGGAEDNFVSTCFRGHGANGLISDLSNTPPYTGEYDADGELSLYNNGRNPNGTWYLIVTDMAAVDTGSVWTWHLTFSNDPTPPIVMPCSTTDATLCVCPDGTQNCDLLPDMTASFQCIMNDHNENGNRLYIGNATPNIGWGPLEIHGSNTCYCDTVLVNCTDTCPNGSGPRQLVDQTIYHKNGNTMTSYTRPAGTMTYHPQHGHIHLDDWAHYSLRRPLYGVQPYDWPIIGTGNKQSYCLVNLGNCSANGGFCVDTAGNVITMDDIPNSPMGAVTGCGTDQGIFTGNLDIYSSGLSGQWVDLAPTVCNGDYYVVSITDPLNVILETNDSNNWTAVPVTLSQQLNMPFPTCNFTYFANGYTLTLMNSSSDFDSLFWNFGDGSNSTGTNPIHTYPGPGDYTIVLTAYNQCGYTQQVVTVTFTTTGISETTTNIFGFEIAPNPTAGSSKIKFSLASKTNLSLDVFDMLGNKITALTSGEHAAGSFTYLFDTDLLNISKGVYTIRLTTDSKVISERVVVMR